MNASLSAAEGSRRLRLPLSPEALLALLSLYWVLVANRPLLSAARAALGTGQLPLVLLWLAALQGLLVLPWLIGRATKPLLLLLSAIAAGGSYFTQTLGTALDPAMLRNVLHTDWREARELLGPGLLLHSLVLLAPAAALIALSQLQRPARRRQRLLRRLLAWLATLALVLGLGLVLFQGLSSLTRNQRTLRYQLLPAAPLWSLPRALWSDARAASRPREAIGLDARPGPRWVAAARPRLLLLVVGETARGANWGPHEGPDGHARDSAPETAAVGLTLRAMQSCGTDTETSLPCMFAPVGRRDYDAERIRGQQSLLQMLQRAGAAVEWRDNQSGCKGVCEGLPEQRLCQGGDCLDEALFDDLPERLRALGPGTHVWVLHLLGNHGPAYHRRYPRQFARFLPDCREDDLGRCSRAEIVNAYDNAILHTDHLLARARRQLEQAADRIDSAILYVSDHGESLGEHGLYLHGLPYAIAPREQTEVPLWFWLAPGWREQLGGDCLSSARWAARSPRHDHLFHTVLGLLDVRTALYQPDWDLLHGCSS